MATNLLSAVEPLSRLPRSCSVILITLTRASRITALSRLTIPLKHAGEIYTTTDLGCSAP